MKTSEIVWGKFLHLWAEMSLEELDEACENFLWEAPKEMKRFENKQKQSLSGRKKPADPSGTPYHFLGAFLKSVEPPKKQLSEDLFSNDLLKFLEALQAPVRNIVELLPSDIANGMSWAIKQQNVESKERTIVRLSNDMILEESDLETFDQMFLGKYWLYHLRENSGPGYKVARDFLEIQKNQFGEYRVDYKNTHGVEYKGSLIISSNLISFPLSNKAPNMINYTPYSLNVIREPLDFKDSLCGDETDLHFFGMHMNARQEKNINLRAQRVALRKTNSAKVDGVEELSLGKESLLYFDAIDNQKPISNENDAALAIYYQPAIERLQAGQIKALCFDDEIERGFLKYTYSVAHASRELRKKYIPTIS